MTWLTLQQRGTLRIHVTNLTTWGVRSPYRTLLWRVTKADRAVLRRLIGKINLTALGDIGEPANSCNSFV
jgi:hypothetical protein